MKTPHAILIGLSLIAAAIFFKDSPLKPARAYGDRAATYFEVKSIVFSCLNGASISGGQIKPGINCDKF